MMHAKPRDLVVVELVMPEMSGEDLLKEMARDPDLADIAVILISAMVQDYYQTRQKGSIEISRDDGFELGEVLKAVDAAVNALAPGWQGLGNKATNHACGSVD